MAFYTFEPLIANPACCYLESLDKLNWHNPRRLNPPAAQEFWCASAHKWNWHAQDDVRLPMQFILGWDLSPIQSRLTPTGLQGIQYSSRYLSCRSISVGKFVFSAYHTGWMIHNCLAASPSLPTTILVLLQLLIYPFIAIWAKTLGFHEDDLQGIWVSKSAF